MNVLYLINYAGSAGTEKYVHNLVEAFQGTKANCHLAYNIGGKLSDDLKAMGIPTLQLEMKHPFQSCQDIGQLLQRKQHRCCAHSVSQRKYHCSSCAQILQKSQSCVYKPLGCGLQQAVADNKQKTYEE